MDHRNDVINCSKLKRNHEPQASGFTAKLWKLWSICFLTITFIFFYEKQKPNNRHFVTCYIISIVYTLIDHSSRPSARGIPRSLSCIPNSKTHDFKFHKHFPGIPYMGQIIAIQDHQWLCRLDYRPLFGKMSPEDQRSDSGDGGNRA